MGVGVSQSLPQWLRLLCAGGESVARCPYHLLPVFHFEVGIEWTVLVS